MYLKYLFDLCRHKWYVFLECRRMGITKRGILHDLSKFSPFEFVRYAQFFDGDNPGDKKISGKFRMAWLHHVHRNKHHWQWWISHVRSDGSVSCFQMPEEYAKEMVADWIGANRAFGEGDLVSWYAQKRDTIYLHRKTRHFVEESIGYRHEEFVCKSA